MLSRRILARLRWAVSPPLAAIAPLPAVSLGWSGRLLLLDKTDASNHVECQSCGDSGCHAGDCSYDGVRFGDHGGPTAGGACQGVRPDAVQLRLKCDGVASRGVLRGRLLDAD